MMRNVLFIVVFSVILSAIPLGQPLLADGVYGITPYNLDVKDAIGVRYTIRVNVNQGVGYKIIFSNKRFYAPNNAETYLLESNIYSAWRQYKDTGCIGWPPIGTEYSGQTGLWVSVPDYNKRGYVGVRPIGSQTAQMFPRQSILIDGLDGLTKIETISQQNLTGKDMSVEYLRGDTFISPLDGWGSRYINGTCTSTLPSGITYRKWLVNVYIENNTYRWEFALPDNSARYLAPWEILGFLSEFLDSSGFFQAYIWSPEVLPESTGIWVPISSWTLNYCADCSVSSENPRNGVKLSAYNDHPVIEYSNDNTDTYFKKGDMFMLSGQPAFSTNSTSLLFNYNFNKFLRYGHPVSRPLYSLPDVYQRVITGLRSLLETAVDKVGQLFSILNFIK